MASFEEAEKQYDEQNLLCDYDSSSDPIIQHSPTIIKRPMKTNTIFLIGLAVYSILLTAACFWSLLSEQAKADLHEEPYTPASQIMSYENVQAHADPKSIYSADPSEEHDQAWRDLLIPMYISASKAELEQSHDKPTERLELVAGGYLATLGIYHELHCLRRIYWHYFPETYFPNQTTEERLHERGHAIHCIESIRKSLMCNPNVALYSFKYRSGGKSPRLQTGAERKCLKWDRLQTWATKRALGISPRYWVPSHASENVE